MPNGDENGGVQGVHAPETYLLSIWLYHNKPAYRELMALVGGWDRQFSQEAGEVLRSWFERNWPSLKETLWAGCPDCRWENVRWHELGMYLQVRGQAEGEFRKPMGSRAEELFRDALSWLANTYSEHHFFAERDLVWTIQRRILQRIDNAGLSYRVFNDYPMLPGSKRALSADLAIVDESGTVLLAAEFKYEPDHHRRRSEYTRGKFPVCTWKAIEKDHLRVREFARRGAKVAYSILVDEGGHFRDRPMPGGTTCHRWSAPNHQGIWVFASRASVRDSNPPT